MRPDDIKFTYREEPDSCAPGDEMDYNELIVESQDAGGGNYIVISTSRWAIDEYTINDFCSNLKKVLKFAMAGDKLENKTETKS